MTQTRVKLVWEDVRRQTQYLTAKHCPLNSDVPSTRNHSTTEGLPIYNQGNKFGHIARNCRAGGMQHQPPQGHQYNSHVRPSMQHQRKHSLK